MPLKRHSSSKQQIFNQREQLTFYSLKSAMSSEFEPDEAA